MLTTEPASHLIQDSAVSYLSNPNEEESVESRLPEPPGTEQSSSGQVCNPPMIISPQPEQSEEMSSEKEDKFSESDWLKRMNQE